MPTIRKLSRKEAATGAPQAPEAPTALVATAPVVAREPGTAPSPAVVVPLPVAAGQRYLRYPEYKDAGVEWLGEVPSHWEVKKLKFLLRRNGLVRGPFGGDLKKETFTESGLKVYEQKNAIYKDAYLGDSYIPEQKFNEMMRFQVLPGDYIMSCSGTIGRVFRIPEQAPLGIINQALLIIRFEKAISNLFADLIFESDFFMQQIIDNSQGGAMKNLVGMDLFTSISLPVPPIQEQRAIAAFLDAETTRIDTLIAKQEALIATLQEKRRALISHAVTKGLDASAPMKDSGVPWLGEVPAHWEVCQFRRIILSMCDGPFGSDMKSSHYVDEGIRLIRLQNIGNGEFDDTDKAYIAEDHFRNLPGHDGWCPSSYVMR